MGSANWCGQEMEIPVGVKGMELEDRSCWSESQIPGNEIFL